MALNVSYSLAIQITSIIGAMVSVYAYFANRAANDDPNYKMFCDLESYNCTALFRSRYGRGFGVIPFIPNGVYEFIFYCAIALLCKFQIL